jgi:hypothetical protein
VQDREFCSHVQGGSIEEIGHAEVASGQCAKPASNHGWIIIIALYEVSIIHHRVIDSSNALLRLLPAVPVQCPPRYNNPPPLRHCGPTGLHGIALLSQCPSDLHVTLHGYANWTSCLDW